MPELTTTAGLWLAVLASGLYHGLNPGMGWPLAVSSALMGEGRRDLFIALGWLAAGHLAAMLAILLPFALLSGLVYWREEIQLGAGLLLVAAGLYLLVNRRHPRFLARIAPHRVAFWSFAVAMAHGAGLMLAPVYLGLCSAAELEQHGAAASLMGANAAMALGVSAAHTLAMAAAGGAMAVAVHAWLGLEFLRKSWFNLDIVWALSLLLVGAVSVALTL